MRGLKKYLVIFLVIGIVNWAYWMVGLSFAGVIILNLILLAVAALFLWATRSVPDEGYYAHQDFRPSIYNYDSHRTENRLPLPKITYPSPKQQEVPAKSVEHKLEEIYSWLSSIDERLGRIEDNIANLYERKGQSFERPSFDRSPKGSKLSRGATSKAARSHYQIESGFLDTARRAYITLAEQGLRNLTIEPVFVILDIDSTERTAPAIGEIPLHFRESENKHSEFVIFTKDNIEGWLFPNPSRSFTEAMKYVFNFLTYANFEELTNNIEPKRVKQLAPEAWEMIPDGR